MVFYGVWLFIVHVHIPIVILPSKTSNDDDDNNNELKFFGLLATDFSKNCINLRKLVSLAPLNA